MTQPADRRSGTERRNGRRRTAEAEAAYVARGWEVGRVDRRGLDRRHTARRTPQGLSLAELLHRDLAELAQSNPWCGYRLLTGMLKRRGWRVNHKRVYRMLREKMPQRGKPRLEIQHYALIGPPRP